MRGDDAGVWGLSMNDFWSSVGAIIFDPDDTEAVVESRLVTPLLHALGYDKDDDIVPKKSVEFHQGQVKKGRPFEADFVVYCGPIKDENTSLAVIEAKRPSKDIKGACQQVESYARVLRTPFIIITNGLKFEIWQQQLSAENSLVFTCSVTELALRRGDAKLFVQRTLARGQDLPTISSAELHAEFPKGALITGPSGFGKTQLCEHLFHVAVGSYSKSASDKIPVEVPLVELVAEGISIFKYTHERINAHCPHITDSKWRDVWRQDGAIIFCDGLERVLSSRRAHIAADISAIRRDFPKVVLFVFSRPSATADIYLPAVRLKELDYEQRQEFQKGIISGIAHNISWDLPKSLNARLGHPLFLRLICEHYSKFGSRPETLTKLFDDWLTKFLGWSDGSPAIRVRREAALLLLAQQSLVEPLSNIAAYRMLIEAGFDEEIFNALVQSDALNISQNNVELVHEALADFLRAKHLASLSLEEFRTSIERTTFRNDSLLATLLMGQIPNLQYQRALWYRLSQSGICEYLAAFKFRADASPMLFQLSEVEAQENVLQDILDGFEQTSLAYFPELWDEICLEEVGVSNCGLCIGGLLDAHLSTVSYSFQMRSANDARVSLAQTDTGFRQRGVNVLLSRLRLDDGRAIGVGVLRETLNKIISGRKLKGGVSLARERLVSRMRILVKQENFPQDCIDLVSIKRALDPARESFVCVSDFQSEDEDFAISALLDDLQICLDAGDAKIDVWWTKYSGECGGIAFGKAPEALIETYKRAEKIFCEIVHFSFPAIRDEMQGYLIRPIQWCLRLNGSEDGDWQLKQWWIPVESYTDPKVVVQPVSELDIASQRVEFNEHYQNVLSRLDKLGRPSDVTVETSSGQLPAFDGYAPNGGFTGETPALTLAHDWIAAELKMLFSDFSAT